MSSICRAARNGTAALLLGLLSAGCEDGATDPAGSYRLLIVGGDQQIGPAGEPLPQRLQVGVLNTHDRPAAGVRVSWTVEESGGSVATASSPSVTDNRGRTSVLRTLGPQAGEHGTKASIEGDESTRVRFTSIAQVQGATQIGLKPDDHGDLQADTVLATLAPFRVLVRDHEDRPVPDVRVQWLYYDGTMSREASTTDDAGVAETTYTFGPEAGPRQVQARVPGLIGSPVVFEVTSEPGTPTRLAPFERDDQPWKVGTAAEPYFLHVTDAHGNPVEGVTVEWAVASGGGSIYPTRTITEPSYASVEPLASATHRLGPEQGWQRVRATATGLPGEPGVTFESRAVTELVHVTGEPIYYGAFDSAFVPYEVVVSPGSTVAWLWGCVGSWYCFEHDVTFEDDPAEPLSAPSRLTGWHLRTFEEPGVYRYRCVDHSTDFSNGHVGVVVVEEEG